MDNEIMKASLRKGFSYGTTSGVITSLGLLIGLYSTTSSKTVILAGLLTIAFADALSDGLGIHVSEESENRFSVRSIWESTFATVFAKMSLGLSFVIPILLFPLEIAILIAFGWGLLVLIILSYKIAIQNKKSVFSFLFKHLALAVFVIIGSYVIGHLIGVFVK
jgi:vacuolar iron transporter family protein